LGGWVKERSEGMTSNGKKVGYTGRRSGGTKEWTHTHTHARTHARTNIGIR